MQEQLLILQNQNITTEHISEAINYRNLDRKAGLADKFSMASKCSSILICSGRYKQPYRQPNLTTALSAKPKGCFVIFFFNSIKPYFVIYCLSSGSERSGSNDVGTNSM